MQINQQNEQRKLDPAGNQTLLSCMLGEHLSYWTTGSIHSQPSHLANAPVSQELIIVS